MARIFPISGLQCNTWESQSVLCGPNTHSPIHLPKNTGNKLVRFPSILCTFSKCRMGCKGTLQKLITRFEAVNHFKKYWYGYLCSFISHQQYTHITDCAITFIMCCHFRSIWVNDCVALNFAKQLYNKNSEKHYHVNSAENRRNWVVFRLMFYCSAGRCLAKLISKANFVTN